MLWSMPLTATLFDQFELFFLRVEKSPQNLGMTRALLIFYFRCFLRLKFFVKLKIFLVDQENLK
jgi:hypothetical protein